MVIKESGLAIVISVGHVGQQGAWIGPGISGVAASDHASSRCVTCANTALTISE